ncbi:hypothetical protein AGMMS49942_19840 [Spirochaetia bacterium]|nr:hypothetical protein AGMMS49942_19840 [Spirochaetia bacterium]
MSNNDLSCTSWEAAIAALETIAGTMPRGTQRETLIAVKTWIQEETPPTLSDEDRENIADFLKKTEGEEKGWDWYCRGSEVINGELVPTEPDDEAEWNCRYNAQAKRWEPTSTPPIIQQKTDFKTEDE